MESFYCGRGQNNDVSVKTSSERTDENRHCGHIENMIDSGNDRKIKIKIT